jgi:O-antigen/teichoic acid export membrane protein
MVSQIPGTVLQAAGRPDLAAKLMLVELPAMVLLNLLLIPRFGITGAAATWSARVIADALLLFWFAHRILRGQGASADFRWVWRSLAAQGAIGVVALILPALLGGVVLRASVFAGFLAVFLVTMWVFFLDQEDKTLILRLGRSVLTPKKAASTIP